MCHTDGKVFKRILVHSVVVAIGAKNNFVPLLKKFYCGCAEKSAHLKVRFECASVTMYFLVMSPFSHDLMKRK